eukprot:CAMPEP_0173452806 /NCGR_PEP_ID=MMETSP1357-20121228/49424_1 /TAXON_ID=77926 /ORGANISM="Hemiselmis rufescens, Strain PCC563" /LENGTH=84 /DNA_ID=CAMNT_0014419711 /DNA_START=26 /DNA_END=277 /DNA_ORIENTATION=-
MLKTPPERWAAPEVAPPAAGQGLRPVDPSLRGDVEPEPPHRCCAACTTELGDGSLEEWATEGGECAWGGLGWAWPSGLVPVGKL